VSASFIEYTTPHYLEGDMLYTASLSTIRLAGTTTMRLADNKNEPSRHNNN